MIPHRMRWGALLLLVVLAAAGCGSSHKSSQSGSGGSKALTGREFVRQANGICKAYYAKFNKLQQPQSLADVGPYVDRASTLIQGELDKLKAIAPPAKLGERYRAFLATGAKELQLTRQLSVAAKAGDAAKVQLLIAQGQRMDTRANRLAKQIGLTVCGQSSSSG